MSLRDASVLDGGMGTLLESLAPSDEKDVASPLWSAAFLLGREDVVREAHRRFRRAGADVLTTTSYQLSKESLERAGVDAARLTALFGASVRLAREGTRAADAKQAGDAQDVTSADVVSTSRRTVLVAASFGSFGAVDCEGGEFTAAFLRGDGGDVARLAEFHGARVDACCAAEGDERPDLFAFETMASVAEAQAVLDVLETRVGHVPPTWLSFTCRDGETLGGGEPFADAVRLLASRCWGATSPLRGTVVGIGINCTPPTFVPQLVATARRVAGDAAVVLAYPNAGEFTWDAEARCFHPDTSRPAWTPSEAGEAASLWRAAGANVVGGCCTTTPAHVAAMCGASG